MSNKILIISQNFYPEIGSAGNRIKNLFKQLEAKGESVNVLTTHPTYPDRTIYGDKRFWDDEFLNQCDDSITRITVSNKKYSFSILNRLFYYLEVAFKMLCHILRDKNTYDIVLVSSPPIFIGAVGLIAKWRYKAKLFSDVRDLWPESLKGVGVFDNPVIIRTFELLEKNLYKRSDEIIVNSKGFIEHISKKAKIPADRITHMPNAAVSTELATPQSEKGQFKVIYAGNIGLAQDEKVLLEIARKLKEHSIELTIIGYGFHKQQLTQKVEALKLDNVTFVKPATRKTCLDLMTEHDVGIVTLTDKEVFDTVLPGKVIDYMTCGVPIVASVSGFSKETILRSKAGYVSERHNADEMVEKILFLRDKPDEKKALSENGIDYVKKHFSWENNIELFSRLIEKQNHNKNKRGIH